MLIQEVKDLNILSLEELLGSSMIQELATRQYNEEETKKKKIIALKSIHKKKMSLSHPKMVTKMKRRLSSAKNLEDSRRKQDNGWGRH